MTKGKSLATDENMSFETNLLQKDNRFDSLTRIQVWAYGVGHFINDLVAACWFNFLFYYLKRVVDTPASNAALLVGQICDGIATLIVGYISDKHNTRWGTYFLKKVKELLGTFLDQCSSSSAIFQFTRALHPKIKQFNMPTIQFCQDCSISVGLLFRSVI